MPKTNKVTAGRKKAPVDTAPVDTVAGMAEGKGEPTASGTSEATSPVLLYRSDDYPTSDVAQRNKKVEPKYKSYVDTDGNLNPAGLNRNNPKKIEATIQQHIRGSEPNKSFSLYTSTSATPDTSKNYGEYEICISLRELENDINNGTVTNVEIIKNDAIVAALNKKQVEAQNNYNTKPTDKNKLSLDRANSDILNTTRDKEILIKGQVPAKYVQVTHKGKS